MINGLDITQEEKRAIAADVKQQSQWVAPLDQARAKLARLDEQLQALEHRAAELRGQLGPVRIGSTDFAARRAIADELEAAEAEARSVRAQRPELEQQVDALDQRLQMEIGTRIRTARHELQRAHERGYY